MENLSEDSVKNILKCLDTPADVITLCNFRKCSYKINKVALKYGFDKVAVDGLAFAFEYSDLNRHWNARIKLPGYHGSAMFSQTKVINARAKTEREESSLDKKLFYICRRLLKTECFSLRMPLNKNVVQKALIKIKSTGELSFRDITLDSAGLIILKEFAKTFRGATIVHIFKCTIKWTSEELLEFLKIFDHISTLSIGNNDMNPTIVTDEHLKLVHKSITVADFTFDIRPFSGITEHICKHWLTTSTTSIFMRSNTSNLEFSSVSTLMENLQKKFEDNSSAFDFENKLLELSDYSFGGLRNTDSDFREIVLGQRNRGTDWKIRVFNKSNKYTVKTDLAQFKYTFSMEKTTKKTNTN